MECVRSVKSSSRSSSYSVQGFEMRLLVGLILLMLPSTAFAYGGGLNAEGCHDNHTTGDYHCHREPEPEYDDYEENWHKDEETLESEPRRNGRRLVTKTPRNSRGSVAPRGGIEPPTRCLEGERHDEE